jgi:hypothetical protein
MQTTSLKRFGFFLRAMLLAYLASLTAPMLAREATAGATADAGFDLVQAFDEWRAQHRSDEARPSSHEIFVSPQGNDAWSGRREVGGGDGPLLSLPAAQRRARETTRSIDLGEQPAKPVHVILLPGTYLLSQTLLFDERDSGRPERPVVYRADKLGTVKLSGGVELLWQRTTDGTATFNLPPAMSIDWKGALQLFVNGRRATLARMPDAGRYWFVQLPDPARPDQLRVDPEAGRWLSKLSLQDRTNLIVNLYEAWTTSRHHLTTVSSSDTLTLDPAPRWPFLNFGRSQRYFVENVAAAMDAPGEWFGVGNIVRYRLRPGEEGRSLVAVLPVLPRLISIASSRPDAAQVQDLEFRGLDFEHSAYMTPATGFVDNQAVSAVGAAVETDRARRIVFDFCSFRRVGAHGIWLRRDVRQSMLSNNLFADLGAGAIRVGVNSQPDQNTAITGDNHVKSNLITDTGAILPGGTGIWLGQTWDNEVSKNLVANTTYTGISVGWKWGFGTPASGRNTIASNLLYNIGQGELADLGGIYTLGESPGTVIRGNVVREVRSYPEYGPDGGKGATGIYQDEGTSDTLVERNFVVGTDSGGYQLHFGRNNTVRSNLFAMGDEAEFRVVKVKADDPSVIATGNLFISRSDKPLFALASPPQVQFKDGVVSAPPSARFDTQARCGDGCRFEQITLTSGRNAKDIQLGGLSDVAMHGWQQVLNEAGPNLPRMMAKVALTRPPSERPQPPVAPTLPVHIEIANAPIGTQPAGLSYRPLGDRQAIRIEQREGSSGPARCLSFNDSGGFKNRFEPFAFASLGRTQGRWSARFLLWVDDRAEFIHEWRDGATPFTAGPSLLVAQGQVRVNDKTIAAIQTNVWHQLTVTAVLGDRTAGGWTLEIIDSAGQLRRFAGLPPKHPSWSELRWVGFVSNAAETAVSCIGSIDIAGPAP